jgi:hypothetical protein
VNPPQGSVNGGEIVSITGRNFGRVTSVTFGAADALISGTRSNTHVVVTAPPAVAKGKVPVTLDTPDGSGSYYSYKYV